MVPILDLPFWLLHANYRAVHISISHSSVFQPDSHHGQEPRIYEDLVTSNIPQIFDILMDIYIGSM